MDSTILISRILHVGLGVFWAGAMFFIVFLLEPSVRSVGPEGGRVMQALQKRGFLTIMPAVAVLTIEPIPGERGTGRWEPNPRRMLRFQLDLSARGSWRTRLLLKAE